MNRNGAIRQPPQKNRLLIGAGSSALDLRLDPAAIRCDRHPPHPSARQIVAPGIQGMPREEPLQVLLGQIEACRKGLYQLHDGHPANMDRVLESRNSSRSNARAGGTLLY